MKENRSRYVRFLFDMIVSTGPENYKVLKTKWRTLGWQTVGDYLKWYNCMDVVPFKDAILMYGKEFHGYGIDLTCDGISLPSLANKILFRSNSTAKLMYIGDADVMNFYKKHVVGGPSIIFNRFAQGKIVGYDCAALYLWALGQEIPTEQPVAWYKCPLLYDTLIKAELSSSPAISIL